MAELTLWQETALKVRELQVYLTEPKRYVWLEQTRQVVLHSNCI